MHGRLPEGLRRLGSLPHGTPPEGHYAAAVTSTPDAPPPRPSTAVPCADPGGDGPPRRHRLRGRRHVRACTDAGIEVSYCLITNGDAGGFDPDVPRSEIPRIRQAEQRAAGAVLGVTDVRFLGYRDGELAVSHELRRDISRVIRQVRPDRMIIQSPERNWGRIQASHPDHLAAGEAAIQAVYPDARNPFAHTSLLQDEGLEAGRCPRCGCWRAPSPTHFHDITDTFDAKIAALRAHDSQTAHMDDLEERVGGWMRMQAANAGLPEGRLAEAFMVVGTA